MTVLRWTEGMDEAERVVFEALYALYRCSPLGCRADARLAVAGLRRAGLLAEVKV